MAYIFRKRSGKVTEITEFSGPIVKLGQGTVAEVKSDDPDRETVFPRIEQVGATFAICLDGQTTIAPPAQVQVDGATFSVALDDEGRLVVNYDSGAAPETPPQVAKVDYTREFTLGQSSFSKSKVVVWLAGLTCALLLVAVGTKSWSIFRPGDVATAHSRIANECSKCHDTWHGPSKTACTECHLGPVHHDNQSREPACVTCHAEHRGLPKLALVNNRECTQCHGALDSKGLQAGKKMTIANLAAQVTDFATDHPQFALAVRDQDAFGRWANNAKAIERIRLDAEGLRRLSPPPDQDKSAGFNKKVQGAIKLNHAIHLNDAKMKNAGKDPLTCASCHKPELDGKRMQKITFVDHCASCHQVELEIKSADKKLPACSVPHGSEERVRDYLRLYFDEKRCEPLATIEQSPRLLLSRQRAEFSQAVKDAAAEAEAALYRDKGCVYCHSVNRDAKTGAKVVFASIPQRWFQQAEFTHDKHRFTTCEECHRGFGWRGEGAAKQLVRVNPRESAETEDLLLPGIETCRSCHRSTMWGTRGAATTNCSSCHLYHDKSKEVSWRGEMGIDMQPTQPKTTTKGAP